MIAMLLVWCHLLTVSKDCNLIDVVTDLKVSKFINYYLFIKKTSSFVLSVFCLDV